MGVFIKFTINYIIVAVIFSVAHADLVNGNDDSCSGKTTIGKVIDVTTSPELAKVVNGTPLDVTLRLTTPFKAKGMWSLIQSTATVDSMGNKVFHSMSTFPVPEEEPDGKIVAKTTVESTGNYAFSLHLEAYEPEITIYFSLSLGHPCNTISLWTNIKVWMLDLPGKDLATALAVPKPVIDLRDKTRDSMKVEVKFNPSLTRDMNAFTYVTSERRSGKLYSTYETGNDGPIDIEWKAPYARDPGRYWMGRAGDNGTVEGVLVLTKRPENLGDIEALTIVSNCNLHLDQGTMAVAVNTQVLLKDFQPSPAIGVVSTQYVKSLVRSEAGTGFYDTDGTRVFPMFYTRQQKLPLVLQCWAAGRSTPDMAYGYVHSRENGLSVVLHGALGGGESPGMTYRYYEAPPQSILRQLGGKADLVCSAADGDVVTSTFFRVIEAEVVTTTTDNEVTNTLDEDTFKTGFQFQCKAEGKPRPTLKFYKQPILRMEHLPPAQELAENGEELQETDRIGVSISEGQATLTVSPGSSPYPQDDEAFRLVCVGANQFTVDAAYVDFIAPNVDIFPYYK